MKPKVSVVIPFFNGADFIREAVESVFAQSLRDWELVLVDDGSTDESSAFAQELAAGDERVRYVTHPGRANRGLAQSRVLGSDIAGGEYLLFLDHDDLLHAHALERLATVLDDHSGIAAVFATTCFRAAGEEAAGSGRVQSFAPLRAGPVPGRKFLRRLVWHDELHPHVCSMMFRLGQFLAARDTASTWHGMYEDTALLVKVTARDDVYLLDEPVSDYRIHGASMSHSAPRDFEGFLSWAAREVPMDRLSRTVIHARRFTFAGVRALRNGRASLRGHC